MRVLIVDEEVPFPLNTGKRLRSYNLLQRLQKEHKITYVCYGNGNEVLPDCPNVTLILLPSPIIEQRGAFFYASLLKNLLSPLPYVVVRHHSELMSQTVQALIAKGGIDLIHCEWTPYTENIRNQLGSVPSVLSAHNVEAQIWERYLATETNPLKKWYIRPQWQKMRAYERQASQIYSQVAVVSEPDRQFFVKDYACSQVNVVPNGVDELYFAPLDVPVKPHSMVFTGSMDWRPNQDGIRYFLEEIFPGIRKTLPDATITVVGRKPPQWLVELGNNTSGVTITGTVDDVRPYIGESSLYVVPLRVGGGSRLKILEALAMQKPVLSTTVGAEGLDVRDPEQLLLRDEPQQFANTAVAMLKQPENFEYLGRAGRELIMRHYTWDAIGLEMERVWRKAVDGQHA